MHTRPCKKRDERGSRFRGDAMQGQIFTAASGQPPGHASRPGVRGPEQIAASINDHAAVRDPVDLLAGKAIQDTLPPPAPD